MNKFKTAGFVLVIMMFMIGCASLGLGGNDEEGSEIANIIDDIVEEIDSIESEDSDLNEGNSSEQEDNDGGDGSLPINSDSALEETDFGKLLASKSLEIIGIEAIADAETVGEILTVHFINNSNDEIQVGLPCGLVFLPIDESEQPLMMIQPLEVNLSAGEEVMLEPFVVCANVATSAPGLGSGYTIGYLEDEDLLKFAECVCGEEIDSSLGSLDSMGIQFATWAISIDGDVLNLVEGNDESVMDEMLEGMSIEEFASYFSGILDTFGNDWLDRCGISLED